jgi:hypothetical protein
VKPKRHSLSAAALPEIEPAPPLVPEPEAPEAPESAPPIRLNEEGVPEPERTPGAPPARRPFSWGPVEVNWASSSPVQVPPGVWRPRVSVAKDKPAKQEEAFGDQGYVYFMEAEGEPVIRIGTTCDLAGRLAHHQSSHYRELRYMRVVPGGRDKEQRWHRDWAHLRIRGEWFELTDDLKAAIEVAQ